jgi:hypothetical protein
MPARKGERCDDPEAMAKEFIFAVCGGG